MLDHTFIKGLHLETKIVVDVAVGGQMLKKSFDEIYSLLNRFSKSNLDWQGEANTYTVHKAAGVHELDVVSTLSTQVASLANQFNKMAVVLNKQ